MNRVSAGEFGRGRTGVEFLEDGDDLRLGEATFSSRESPWAKARNSRSQPEPFCHLGSGVTLWQRISLQNISDYRPV